MMEFWLEQLNMRNQQCETLMANNEILNKLNYSDYDLVLADPSVPCGELLAAKDSVTCNLYRESEHCFNFARGLVSSARWHVFEAMFRLRPN